jgi:hypothetical protein
MAKNRVRALLMGGQACVFYGAAEFSRDTDLAIAAEPGNLECLRSALGELQAGHIAVPPFEMDYLQRGHGVHFRCHHPEAADMRVDIMSTMRGVDPFEQLWERRVTIEESEGDARYELLSIPDLVKTKKTQREKDWPMIRRLVEADYVSGRSKPNSEQLRFWLREMRTPEWLIELGRREPNLLRELLQQRPLLTHALKGETEALGDSLETEEKLERDRDRVYWQPLKAELERLRHKRE